MKTNYKNIDKLYNDKKLKCYLNSFIASFTFAIFFIISFTTTRHDAPIEMLLLYFLISFVLVFLIAYLATTMSLKEIKEYFKNASETLKEDLNNELEHPIIYMANECILLNNYIIALNDNKFKIFNLEDIVSVKRENGKPDYNNKYATLKTKDKREMKVLIDTRSIFGGTDQKLYDELIRRCPNLEKE